MAATESAISSRRRSSLARVPVSDLRLKETHRLIASKYSEGGTVLSRLSSDPATLGQLMELDDATNDRFLGEEGLLPGIGIHELIYGVRYAHIVNAAFTHASPAGGRFNGSTRGAWYAALDRSTAIAEVAFHKLLQLGEIDWPHEEVSTFDDYLAEFVSPMHDLRGEDAALRRYLAPEPIPRCYIRSQALAAGLLHRQSNGIVYPSVRRAGGQCIVCFRPALVYNVNRGARLEFRLRAGQPFRPKEAREVDVPDA